MHGQWTPTYMDSDLDAILDQLRKHGLTLITPETRFCCCVVVVVVVLIQNRGSWGHSNNPLLKC